jgi:F-type H+-transporting ATPase subunit epsilon
MMIIPELQCLIVTPEKTVLDQQAEFVALPLYDGEIGIAPGHTPMIGRLGSGEMRIRAGEQTSRFYVEGGFVEVLGNVVTVLTSRAVPAGELDAAVAAEQLEAAQRRPAHSDEEFAQRDRLTTQYRAQARVARRARGTS